MVEVFTTVFHCVTPCNTVVKMAIIGTKCFSLIRVLATVVFLKSSEDIFQVLSPYNRHYFNNVIINLVIYGIRTASTTSVTFLNIIN